MKNLYSLASMLTLIFALSLSHQQSLNAADDFSWYCDSTDDPVAVLPWLTDLIDEVNNNDCLCNIAAYCYRGQVYFSPLSNPRVRCSDVLFRTYNVHGRVRFERGGIAGVDTYPDDFGNATLIRTITTCDDDTSSGSSSNGSSSLSVWCPQNIHVDCNDNSEVCWNLPEATTTCNTCPSDHISGYLYMGTFNGSKYYCSDGKATWEQAQAACHSLGGYLASVTSSAENHFLANVLQTQSAFIGGHDRNRDGVYNWISGEAFGNYTNWYQGQPNNYQHNQYYIEMLSDGRWNDEYPTRKNEYICEIPCGGTSPTITGPATCGTFGVGTTPIKYTISDDCGNTKTCQFKIVVESSLDITCPNDIVVQNNSHTSGVNVSWDDPQVSSCCNNCNSGGGNISGFIYMGKHGNSYYYCSKDPASWQTAKSNCVAKGGHLAIITNAAENSFLANQLQTQSAWIGCSDDQSEGHFRWVDGTSLGDYQPWYPGQPNNHQGRQDYCELLSNGQWNDQYHYALEYIMEIPATCLTVDQTGGPHSGSAIANGTQTIKYTAKDGCGNTATCSFNVKVVPPSSANVCTAGGHNSNNVWIKKVQFANIWNETGSNGGYKSFTSSCASASPGQTYHLKLMPGFYANIYTCYWKVYIDYNNDGDFNDHGEYVARGSGTKALSGSIKIPSGTRNGKKRMRCIMKVGSYPSGPCATYSYGETEDYCVNVSGGWIQDEAQAESRSREDEGPIDLSGNNVIVTQISVNPNPSTGFINLVNLGDSEISSVEIIDQAGRKVMTINAPNNSKIQLDLSEYTSGLYFVRTMFSNGQLEVSKVSIVK